MLRTTTAMISGFFSRHVNCKTINIYGLRQSGGLSSKSLDRISFTCQTKEEKACLI